MILKKGSFADFAQRVRVTEKKVIVYGAGVVGQMAAPYWLQQYKLEHQVLCFADADLHKQGQYMVLGAYSVPVCAPSILEKEGKNCVLLITVSAFEPVIEKLKQFPETENTEVYFLPLMLLDIAHTAMSGEQVLHRNEKQLIPKRIHYCWFSGRPIPETLKYCMDSWRRFCPDYEFIRWDEGNYDIHKNRYVEQAYEQEKWGFVPDFIRLDVLYRYGGIYLDTDVELIRNLDELLYQPAFCGVEKWGTVNFGGCSGAQAGNSIVKEMLEARKHALFIRGDGSQNLTACGYYETRPLLFHGLQLNNQTQTIADGAMTVYASEFFHPFDYMSGITRITENTFSVHHFSGTWLGEEAMEERLRTKRHYENFLSQLK